MDYCTLLPQLVGDDSNGGWVDKVAQKQAAEQQVMLLGECLQSLQRELLEAESELDEVNNHIDILPGGVMQPPPLPVEMKFINNVNIVFYHSNGSSSFVASEDLDDVASQFLYQEVLTSG
jgi:hypothetical protein